jgi:hypothetical protein
VAVVTSTVYADPANGAPGPSASVAVPASGRVLVTITARISPGGSNTIGLMSFSATGSPPSNADGDTTSLSTRIGSANVETAEIQASATYVVSGLTPGPATVKAYYRTSAVLVDFRHRNIIAIPLP